MSDRIDFSSFQPDSSRPNRVSRADDGTIVGTLRGQTFELSQAADGGWVGRFEGTASFDFDTDEVRALLDVAGRPSDSGRLARAGVDIDLVQHALRTGRHRADHERARSVRSVLLDTTSVANALNALRGMHVDPIALLDLSALTFAICLYDQVIVQAGARDAFAYDEVLGDAVLEVRFDRDEIVGPLWSMCAEVFDHVRRPDGAPTPLDAAWRTFFRRPEITLDSLVANSAQDSPQYWNGVPASYYVDQVPAGDPSNADELSSLNDFLSVQTIRTLFNDQVAAALQVPYVPTTLRTPIQAMLLADKLESQLLADRLLAGLGPAEAEDPPKGGYVAEVTMPFLLGIAFSRMATPTDFPAVVTGLRDELRPLRERLLADRDGWEGRRTAYAGDFANQLANELPDSLRRAETAVEATATAAASVATGSPVGGGFAKLAIKLVKLLRPADHGYRWYRRTFRPDIHVAVELATEASRLRSADSEIARLWPGLWSRQDQDRLTWLAQHRPESFARLRSMGGAGR